LFNGRPPPDMYTLSLHDALPIFHEAFEEDRVLVDVHAAPEPGRDMRVAHGVVDQQVRHGVADAEVAARVESLEHQRVLAVLQGRSEEHTSELQSLAYLVCRLLLE